MGSTSYGTWVERDKNGKVREYIAVNGILRLK